MKRSRKTAIHEWDEPLISVFLINQNPDTIQLSRKKWYRVKPQFQISPVITATKG